MSEWNMDSQEQQNITPDNNPEQTPPAAQETAEQSQPVVVSSIDDVLNMAREAETPPAEQTVVPPTEPQPTPPYQPQPPYTPPYQQTFTQSPYQQPHYQQPYQPVIRKKRNKTGVLVAVLAVLCCLSLIVTGVLAAMLIGGNEPSVNSNNTVVSSDEDDRVTNKDAPSLQITDADDINDGGLTASEIIAKNLDATVVLTMYQRDTSSAFYGYYGFESSDNLTQAGGASGIVMSEDGYIITNSHCVFDEDSRTEFARIDVTLYNGDVYEAKIIGYDPTTDLAVIKIDAKGLTPAEFGDSSALTLGSRVITLGNSGGLQWSASQGILSGQARDVYEDTGYAIKCLQVDAVINPGSSGGPLINAYGQVVGVNSAKIVLTGYEGLGFSIPINEAKAVIDDLLKYGYVTGRVSIGITGRSITSVGYEGFMIESINTDSSMMNTKAQAGDIITHVNGVRVMSYAEMRAEIVKYNVGDTVKLTLLRLDRQLQTTHSFDITITLQESK